MTSAVEPAVERCDVRTIVGGGVKLAVLTVVTIVVFAMLSRALDGTIELVVQSLIVLIGGLLASFLPPIWVRPRSADAIAWAALIGLLGALAFTVVDTVVLRPLGVYHWTWDAIGGGSGFWYIPVWWMGAALLAWLGSWTAATVARAREAVNIKVVVAQVVGLTAIVLLALVLTNAAPARPAVVGLALTVSLALAVPLATALSRR